jgi:hypothetical protein
VPNAKKFRPNCEISPNLVALVEVLFWTDSRAGGLWWCCFAAEAVREGVWRPKFLCTLIDFVMVLVEAMVARYFLKQYTKNVGKYTKLPQLYQIALEFTKWSQNFPNYRKIYQQGPPKFTQIGIFGLKIYHLATLVEAVS